MGRIRNEQEDLDQLLEFKKWFKTMFRKHCEKSYGKRVFSDYINPYCDDLLECVEYHIEDLAIAAVQAPEPEEEDI